MEGANYHQHKNNKLHRISNNINKDKGTDKYDRSIKYKGTDKCDK